MLDGEEELLGTTQTPGEKEKNTRSHRRVRVPWTSSLSLRARSSGGNGGVDPRGVLGETALTRRKRNEAGNELAQLASMAEVSSGKNDRQFRRSRASVCGDGKGRGRWGIGALAHQEVEGSVRGAGRWP